MLENNPQQGNSLSEFVSVVLEGHNVLVPAWQVAANLHGHQLCQPGYILNLLLLQLQESIEAAEMEAILECL